MIKYQRNNIIFRIASSDAISKFKHTQAHAFVQLARPEFSFDVSAREVVLLEYDRISQWLYRIERILQSVGEGEMPIQLRTAVMESFREEINVIETVLETHPEVFDAPVVEFAKLIHVYTFFLMEDQMACMMDDTIDRAFVELADLVSEYLQHLLICLHEYNSNCILRSATPFVSIGDFCLCIKKANRRFLPIIKRIQFFKKMGCGDTYVFKNYSTHEDMFEKAVKALKSAEVTLIPEQLPEEVAIAADKDPEASYAYA